MPTPRLSMAFADRAWHAGSGKRKRFIFIHKYKRTYKYIFMEITIIETSAYLELKRQLSMLSVQLSDFQKKVSPVSPEKWLDAQEVCLALGISKRSLQNHRDRGLIPYSSIGGKCFYKEADIQKILEEGLIRKRKK